MSTKSKTAICYGATSGDSYEVEIDNPLGKGAMKQVYPVTNGKYVVACFLKDIPPTSLRVLRNGLEQLMRMHDRMNADASTRDYWNKVIVWPKEFIQSPEGELAFAMPLIPSNFRFAKSELTSVASTWPGSDKSARCFATTDRFRNVAPQAQGTLRDYFKITEHLARAIRYISQGGRSYGDISLNNVLVDPATSSMMLIDIDNVTVNCDASRSVKGTSGYQAPEVYFDSLVPTSAADYFSLAVMIYKFLHLRHPFLRDPFNNDEQSQQYGGGKISKADFVYIENENNRRARYTREWVEAATIKEQQQHRSQYLMPWWDLDRLPSCRVVGRPMAEMFKKTFVDALFDPDNRPTAESWERALIRAQGRLLDCANPRCMAKAFVFDQSNYDKVQRKLVCPFCGTPVAGSVFCLQVLEDRTDKRWIIMAQENRPRKILKWEIDPRGGEYLDRAELSEPVAEIAFIDGEWVLRNFSGYPISVVDSAQKLQCLNDGAEIVLSKGMRFYRIKNGREFVVAGRL